MFSSSMYLRCITWFMIEHFTFIGWLSFNLEVKLTTLYIVRATRDASSSLVAHINKRFKLFPYNNSLITQNLYRTLITFVWSSIKFLTCFILKSVICMSLIIVYILMAIIAYGSLTIILLCRVRIVLKSDKFSFMTCEMAGMLRNKFIIPVLNDIMSCLYTVETSWVSRLWRECMCTVYSPVFFILS